MYTLNSYQLKQCKIINKAVNLIYQQQVNWVEIKIYMNFMIINKVTLVLFDFKSLFSKYYVFNLLLLFWEHFCFRFTDIKKLK